MVANEKDVAASPVQALEDQVSRLEAEMEVARRQFHEEEERWETAKDDPNRSDADRDVNLSGMDEDVTMSEDAVTSIQQQMKAEMASLDVLGDDEDIVLPTDARANQHVSCSSKKDVRNLSSGCVDGLHDGEEIPPNDAKAESTSTDETNGGAQQTSRASKNDVRNLASMFEKRLSTAALPRPPPASKPFRRPARSASFERGRASFAVKSQGPKSVSPNESSVNGLADERAEEARDVAKRGAVTGGASLSIEEGKALFERAFSPPGAPESRRSIRPKVPAEPKGAANSPVSRNRDNSKEIPPDKKAPDEADRSRARLATQHTHCMEQKSTADATVRWHSLSKASPTSEPKELQSLSTNELSAGGFVNHRVHARDVETTKANVKSLSAREGKALFERAFSPPGIPSPGGLGSICYKGQAKPNATIASQSSQHASESQEARCESESIPATDSKGLQSPPANELGADGSVNHLGNARNATMVEARVASLSIREGKALFERALSPPSIPPPDRPRGIRAKVRAHENRSDEVAPKQKSPDEVKEAGATSKPSKGEYETLSIHAAPPSSLRDRISMIETSKLIKLPAPPVLRSKPAEPLVDLGVGDPPSPEPEPLVSPPPTGSQSRQGSVEQIDATNKVPTPPKKKFIVSPPLPFTPIRPKKTLAPQGNRGERSTPSIVCSDEIIHQRRAALMRDMKTRLNEESVGSTGDEETPVADVTVMDIFSSPIPPNAKKRAAEKQQGRVCASSQKDSESALGEEANEHNSIAVHVSQIERQEEEEFLGKRLLYSGDNRLNANDASKISEELGQKGHATMPSSEIEDRLEGGLLGEAALSKAMPAGSQPDTNGFQLSSSVNKPSPPKRSLPEKKRSCGSQLYKSSRSCTTSTFGNMKVFIERALIFLRPWLSAMWNCFWAFAIFCWIKISSLASILVKNTRSLSSSGRTYMRECLDDHRVIIALAPNAFKTVGGWAADMDRGVALCFTSMTFAMFADMYPTAPGNNIFVALLLLFFQIDSKLVSEVVFICMNA